MRITWKDSAAPARKPSKYRGHWVTGYEGGWITDLPGDNNIYRSCHCAENAIDKALGGTGRKGEAPEKRRACGIQIVGTR